MALNFNKKSKFLIDLFSTFIFIFTETFIFLSFLQFILCTISCNIYLVHDFRVYNLITLNFKTQFGQLNSVTSGVV